MNIKITQETSEGQFTVGAVYEVNMVSKVFVWAYDDVGELEPVYNYEFVEV